MTIKTESQLTKNEIIELNTLKCELDQLHKLTSIAYQNNQKWYFDFLYNNKVKPVENRIKSITIVN
jgi:hypothetical protein